MFFRVVYKFGQIFLPFCHNTRVCQTDRRTDGQTEFSSQYMQRGKNRRNQIASDSYHKYKKLTFMLRHSVDAPLGGHGCIVHVTVCKLVRKTEQFLKVCRPNSCMYTQRDNPYIKMYYL